MKRAVEADCSGLRGRKIVALGASMSKFAIAVASDSDLYEPEMLKDKQIAVTPNNGSHFTTLKMMEGFLAPEHVKTTNAGSPPRSPVICNGVTRCNARPVQTSAVLADSSSFGLSWPVLSWARASLYWCGPSAFKIRRRRCRIRFAWGSVSGTWSARSHLPALKGSPDFELTAVFAPAEAKRR
jgi:hypothetical protein